MSKYCTISIGEKMKKILPLLIAIAIICSAFSPENAEAATTKWRQLYLSYIKQQKADAPGYTHGALIYMNGDSVPELVLEGSTGGLGCRLLMICKGKVYDRHAPYGGLKYIEKKNRFYLREGNLGAPDGKSRETIAKIKGNKIINLAWGDCKKVQTHDSDKEPLYRWYWNKKRVSKRTYEKKLRKAMGKNTKKYVSPKMIPINDLEKILRGKQAD